MREIELQSVDDGSGRRRSRRRRGVAALVTVGAVAAVSLVGMTSASARTPTQTMVGRAFALAVETASQGKSTPIVGPIADTGVDSTTTAGTVSPPCTVLTGTVSALSLCNQVTTATAPADVSSSSSIATIEISLVGVPKIVVRAVSVSSETTCAGSVGSTTIAYLSVGGIVVIGSAREIKPNTTLAVGPIKLVLNQQVPAPAPNVGLRVNAVHVQVGNATSSTYVSVGHAESLIRKCVAPTP